MRSSVRARGCVVWGLALVASIAACDLRPSREFVPVRSAQSGPPPAVVKNGAGAGEADPPSLSSIEWDEVAADKIVSRRLANGVMFHAIARNDLPVATVLVVYGARSIPHPGAAARIYAGAALRGRAMPWSRQELQGARTFAIARHDWIALGLTVLAPVLERVLEKVLPGMMEASLWDIDFHDSKLALIGGTAGDEPARRSYATAMRGLFPPPHPYGSSAEAWIRDRLLEATLAEVRDYRDAHHSTDNVVVTAAGSFEPGGLAATLEKALAPIPQKPKIPPPAIGRPAGTCAGTTTGNALGGTSQAYVTVAYPGVTVGHADEPALDVLAAALGGSLSTRLYDVLRARHGASYTFGATNETMREGGAFVLRGDLDPSRTKDAMAALDSELERVGTSELGDEELRVAKAHAAHHHRFGDSGSTAIRLADYAILGASTTDTTRIRAVTAGQVKDAAARYLRRDKRCVSIAGD